MLNRTEFHNDIIRLRELSLIAPFVEYEKAREELVRIYCAELPKTTGSRVRSLSELYELIARGADGSSVYTPPEMAGELYGRTPVISGARILDCSGGTGNLVRPFLNASIPVTLMDTDPDALIVAELENPGIKTLNESFLETESRWDVIIGNPPYKGHKTMAPAEKAWLKEHYPMVMDNKSDLYNAFFAKGWASLSDGGILSFIVSRYWLESESARALRRFILDRFRILYIHDWYGERPFGAGVDPLLIILRKEKVSGPYDIKVLRQDAGSFRISSQDLTEASMKLLTERERALRRVIADNTITTLGQAGEFRQGIITGFDKAFIMTREEAREQGIEDELLVPWIKSRDLRGMREAKFLIYAPRDPAGFPGFLKYIEGHRERLSSRREVRLGLRGFHELQWGRRREFFEGERILFAYKAPSSGFTVRRGLFHSADVYSYNSNISLQWLCTILNSPLYDTYIKTELKKLGRDLYEYYPHRLNNIRIPDPAKYPDPGEYLMKIEKELDYEYTGDKDSSGSQ